MIKKITIFIVLIIAIVCVGNFLSPENVAEAEEENVGQVKDIYSPYKIEGFGAGWITSAEFDGANLSDNALVEALNIDFGSKTSIAPRQGSEILGTESTEVYPIYSIHTSKSITGRELLVRTSTTTIEWYNSIDDDWDYLKTSIEASSTANLEYSFADGNDSNETEVYTYFANGTDSIGRFRVAFGSVSSNTSTEIILNSVSGYSSATELGFDSTGTVTVDGANYTYDAISSWNLQGLSGLPTSTANEGVISTIETTGFTSAPASATAIVIKDQRLYAAYKNSVFCSQIDDLQNFSYSAPREGAEGEIAFFPDGGQKINGLGVKPDYVAVFKDDYIGRLEFKDLATGLTDVATIKTISKGIDIGAVSQKAISNLGFEVVFANNDIGATNLTRLANTDFDQTISFTERIRPTMEDYDFSNTAIVVYKNLILNAVSDSTTDFNNRIIMYDSFRNRLTELQGWNANAFAVYDDYIYYGDAISKNVYKIFTDEYDDNDLPYSTSFKTKWFNFGEPTRWKEIGWVFVEGFINENTTLSFKINLDEGGSLSSKQVDILGTGDYVSSVDVEGFGLNPFGILNFSNIEGSSDNLLHFSGWINTGDIFQHKFRNIQFEGSTNGTSQNYRLSKIIPYVNVLDEAWSRSYAENIINPETTFFGSELSDTSELSPLGAVGGDWIRIGADSDGSWRFYIDSNNLLLQKKESGVWSLKDTYEP